MNLSNYRFIFTVNMLILILVVSMPLASRWLPFSNDRESFSELWILGPEHVVADYPFAMKVNERQFVYLGLNNHLGYSAYYVMFVKFRNQTESYPNPTNRTSSLLVPLYEYRIFLENNATWEAPLTFSILSLSFANNHSIVTGLMVNDQDFIVDKSSEWDVDAEGYYYQLFIELWIHDIETDQLQFHNRFVGIWMNMTRI